VDATIDKIEEMLRKKDDIQFSDKTSSTNGKDEMRKRRLVGKMQVKNNGSKQEQQQIIIGDSNISSKHASEGGVREDSESTQLSSAQRSSATGYSATEDEYLEEYPEGSSSSVPEHVTKDSKSNLLPTTSTFRKVVGYHLVAEMQSQSNRL
jgi:hypothetical protein